MQVTCVMRRPRRQVAALLLLAAAGLAGCAQGSASGGDPGARPMPAGMTCQSVRGELNALDARGAQSRVQAAAEGRKVAPQYQGEVSRYNELLSYYLGARCHV